MPNPISIELLVDPVGAIVGLAKTVGALQQADIEGLLWQAEEYAGIAQYPCPFVPRAQVKPD